MESHEPGTLVRVDPATFQYRGLTQEGVAKLREARDILRERILFFDRGFKNLSTVHHAAIVARLHEGNMFLYGPPGGAKSALVNWLLAGEADAPFKLQLHQMLTEQAFTGGQNYEAAREGRFELNTKGSLGDFRIALIDEIDKGNPAALSALLSLLNEREILAGGAVVKAKLETLFATSNANLPEILQHFIENGQGSTAPALLNRFQFKAFVYNWLSPLDQGLIDNHVQKIRYLKSLAAAYPEAWQDAVFRKPRPLDWSALRQIANSVFTLSPLFMTMYRELVNDMREQTHRAIRESEQRYKKNYLDEPFVYFPSAEYTERLRQQIPEIVLLSAFVDFLLSPLADDDRLSLLQERPLSLDPLSLWRAALVMTTIGPGRARLVYDPNRENPVDIDFNWSFQTSSARDDREELLIKNLKSEQERFRRAFLSRLTSLREQMELMILSFPVNGKTPNRFNAKIDEASFELAVMQNSSD